MIVSLSTQILILIIAPLSFISVSILCEYAMLPDVYILLSPQEEEVHWFSWGNRCTHLAALSSKKIKHFACHYISMHRYYTKKNDCKANCFVIGPPSVLLLIVIDELGLFHQYLHQMFTLRESIIQDKQGIQLC